MQIFFIHIGVREGFSGQVKATELIIDGLEEKGVLCSRALLPYFDRTERSSRLMSCLFFLIELLQGYWKLLLKKLPSDGAIHLSLGLTRFALIRDGLALCCAATFNPRSLRRVVALNGSVFTEWRSRSLNAKLFRWVIRQCDVVTCVGHSHRKSLQRLGVPAGKIEVVPNVCEYDGVPEAEVIAKQASSGGPFELLFLSSLTDTKGYPEYLEALEMIARKDGPPIHAVLCGPIMMDAYRKRFDTSIEAKDWIEQKVVSINQSAHIQVEWIPGARGPEKKALFEQAQVFVLPTQYPVEAQPLVIIEAMAHGCAIVTTDVGELPSTVDAQSAVILSLPTAVSVTESIRELLEDDELRLSLGLGALAHFKSKFNREQYVQRWSELIGA